MATKTVKLPRTRDGKKVKHPMLELLETVSAVEIAKKIGIDRTTVYFYSKGAQEDRDFLVHAEKVLTLAEMAKIHPYYWRPDLYPKIGISAVVDNLNSVSA